MTSVKEKEVSETLELLNREKMSYFGEKGQLRQKRGEAVRGNADRIRQEELDRSRQKYEKKAKNIEKLRVNAHKQIMYNRVANQLIHEQI